MVLGYFNQKINSITTCYVLEQVLTRMSLLLMGSGIIFLFAFLNGCSSSQRHDGPPPFDVDVTHIPNAEPKHEKLAKYGNMPKYRVFGKEYYVMKNAKNYQERGVASWYGKMFHQQRTSSGERYNMLAMTAAHRTLPLPTYVEVTNLKNGKKIIVKVNDRGPFASNRIIDLSYVAAKKLGMLGRGTTTVDVKAIDLQKVVVQPTFIASNHINRANFYKVTDQTIYLQVGAFKNKLSAEELKKRLMPMVASPIQITHLNKYSKRLYRVKIGPIRDLAGIDNLKKKLRAIGLSPKHIKA